MNAIKKTSRTIVAALIAGGALLGASSAFAQYAPVYGQPHMMPVGVQVNIGWHGDRYYDGHRYWAHDDWMRHHPHDRDPYHDRDHRPPPPRY
ncbi:hypothetical protein [Burkholderia sp. Ac-20365]|jgi:hypothetical protein|uniref:hypothetical protein n=1 Tax=Burkholderia sp. Ac-20365 TaxID=2703897 RepID=UPI00197CA457|nr:hypothetical protein [Burkholderia sp. Ac-20365]MBN3767231.1 hypothetical protein [Burkholderia sp. Ac-20365]